MSNLFSPLRISRSAKTVLSRWSRSRRGNIAIISALAMPCLVGFCGMGADVGYWYYRQRILQGAADITAFNGAIALSAKESTASIISQGSSDAAANGWSSSQGTITVNTPPQSGPYKDNANSVEVLLTENEPRFFSNFFSGSTVKVSVRAVANYKVNGDACILALDRTAKTALQFWGHNSSTFKDCNVMSDSLNNESLGVSGDSTVTVPCALAVGDVYVTSTLNLTSCNSAQSNQQPAADPYANVSAPTVANKCVPWPNSGPYFPNTYCDIDVKDTESLNPGVYVIDGGKFSMNANANLTGAGVMFYLTNGATLSFNGNAIFNLSAPTTAPYEGGESGILFFSDRSQATADQTINGTSTSVLTGALYFPTQALTLNGDFVGADGCTQMVADTITYSGNATLSGDCTAYGMNTIPIPGGTTLVE